MDAEWTSRHLECDPQEAAERILIQIRESGLPELPGLLHRESHRWRYAKPVAGLSDTEIQENKPACFWDRSQAVGACGDGWVGTGIEGALESGRAMAGRIINWLTSLGPSEASLVKPVKPGGYIQRELF
jgi:predicted NAD/FAD-dependent oxidoreductase